MHSAFIHEPSPRAQKMSLPLLLAAALILGSTQARADPSCRTVQGSASLKPVPARTAHPQCRYAAREPSPGASKEVIPPCSSL